MVLFLKYEGNRLDPIDIYILTVHKHSHADTSRSALNKGRFMQPITNVVHFQAYLAGLNYKADSSELLGILKCGEKTRLSRAKMFHMWDGFIPTWQAFKVSRVVGPYMHPTEHLCNSWSTWYKAFRIAKVNKLHFSATLGEEAPVLESRTPARSVWREEPKERVFSYGKKKNNNCLNKDWKLSLNEKGIKSILESIWNHLKTRKVQRAT